MTCSGKVFMGGGAPSAAHFCQHPVCDAAQVQGSEVPSLGTFSGTLSGKWAKVGKMGENGGKRGKFRLLGGKMGNLGAEKAKNQGLGWQQGCGGGALVKAPEEKWGKMGKAPEEKWGRMGKNGGKWGKMGENGEEMGRKCGGNGGKGDRLHHPSFLIFPHFPPFSPIPPPFSPIFPHFPPFFLAMGTLWVRLWVQYPPPEPGTSEPCK